MLEGVLQQLVNCFLEASGGSLTFSHRLVISSQKSAWVELKTNLKHRECVFFHFGVCWNSLSTASWMHLQEISWIVQKRKFFSPLFFHTFHQLTNEVNWHSCWKVCCSSLSNASWRHLEDDLLSDIDLLFHPKKCLSCCSTPGMLGWNKKSRSSYYIKVPMQKKFHGHRFWIGQDRGGGLQEAVDELLQHTWHVRMK